MSHPPGRSNIRYLDCLPNFDTEPKGLKEDHGGYS